MWGIFGKPLKRAIWNTLGLHAVLTSDDMFEIFVCFRRRVCCLLPLFFNRQLPCLHTNSRHGLLLPPDAPQKPLTRKRARSGGVKWVQVVEIRI